MAAPKPIQLVGGQLTETAATPVGGAGNEEKIVSTGADGRIDPTLMPTGIGAETQNIVASEALAAGDLVNVWSDSGTFKVRKADASIAGKEAHGFVLSAFAANASALVYFEGANTQVTGLTPGAQFLSAATAGRTAAAAPTGTGKVVQKVGFATSATSLTFSAGDTVVRA